MSKKLKICLLVSNDLTRDPRVTKQAETCAKAGYETLVNCWAYGDNHPPLEEKKDGYSIHRSLFNPYWNPKIANLNFSLAKFNLLLVMKFAIQKIKKYYRFIFLVLRYIFVKIPLKIIWWFLRCLAKIFHIVVKPGILRRHLPFLTKKQTILPSPPVKPEIQNVQIKVESNQKESLSIRIIKILNIYRYYHHYYKSMYVAMVEQGIKFKPDIVHANDLDTLLPGYLIKRKTGCRLIYDAHEIWTEQGLAYPKIVNWGFKILEKFLFGKIDHFITVNKSLADELDRTYHFPRNLKQTIIYNCPRYQELKFKKHNPRKIVALYQGRYSPNRGLEQIVESARYLDKGIELHFRGLGDENLLKEMKEMAQKINRKNIKFHPPVEMKDLVHSAFSADIGLIAYIPIHIDNELCMPNKVFEYMMSGLALAVSDLPELSRLVKIYRNGVTFDPLNPKDIAKKINWLASHDLLNLRRRSLEAAKICNWETEEQKLKQIYESLR